MNKTSKFVTKATAAVLSLAMVAASLSVTGTESLAKAKIKSVKVTSPVTNGGKLVLKKGQKKQVKVKVTKSGKISTKVTYKSSNSKVAKVVKSKGKVYVKAVGKNGKSAKITITSKANKKKKATLKVKIGTPIKKVAISKLKVSTSVTNNKEADASKRTKTTNKSIKFVSYKKTKLQLVEKYDDKAADTGNQQLATISVKYTPTKVGYKGMKWKAKNSKIVYVSPYGVVTPVKPGKTTIYGYTKDGTNKKVKLDVVVKAKPTLATPTPFYEPEDKRQKTVVEDFESYAEGYNWEDDAQEGTAGKATKGKEYADKNCGKMTVVKDPENPNNKCLKIEYNGDTQAYDYAPIFNLNLGQYKKKLDDFSAVMIQSRVVAKNTGDAQHKTVAAYFSKKGKITPEHYFDTSLTVDDANKKGIPADLVKFSTDASHATGKDETYNVKGGEFDYMTYNNKSFPMFYNDWAKEKIDANRTVGFKESEDDKYKAGWHQNKLELNKGNISEDGVLNSSNISMVIGSTYSGQYQNASLTLYIDDLTFLEGETPCTAVSLNNKPTKIAKGLKMSIAKEDIVFAPENTTQTALTWSSSDENIIKVDGSKSSPVIEAVNAGKATLKAVVTKNPSVSMSFEVEVFEPKAAASDWSIDLSKVKVLPKNEEGSTAKTFSSFDGCKQTANGLEFSFTQANNDHICIDLGQTYDLTQYKGFSIVGEATDQMSFELYRDDVDLQQDDWWIKQVEYAGYPFFGGSHGQRSFEGTSYGPVGVEENVQVNWVGTPEAPSTSVPGGDLTNVRYIVFKANKFDTGLHEHKWIVKSLTFKKDAYVNPNPTDAEIEANGGKWFDKSAQSK